MRIFIIIIALLLGLVSCKTTLIVNDFKAENIPNSENILTIDSSIIQLVQPYKDGLKADMQQVIGISSTELVKKKPESLLTNYLADLLLEEGRLYAAKLNEKSIPQVAYINYGGIRADLPKGEITVGRLFELMPFENEIVLLSLKGTDMIEFAEKIAEHNGDGVSGMKMGIKNGKPVDLEVGGAPVDKTATYWVVTNDYVANGGDGMKMFLNRLSYILTGIRLRDCIIDHMRKDYQAGRIISPKLDGRIYNE